MGSYNSGWGKELTKRLGGRSERSNIDSMNDTTSGGAGRSQFHLLFLNIVNFSITYNNPALPIHDTATLELFVSLRFHVNTMGNIVRMKSTSTLMTEPSVSSTIHKFKKTTHGEIAYHRILKQSCALHFCLSSQSRDSCPIGRQQVGIARRGRLCRCLGRVRGQSSKGLEMS